MLAHVLIWIWRESLAVALVAVLAWLVWLGSFGASVAVLALLVGTSWPLRRAWSSARGTALRPAVAWMMFAIALDVIAQVHALSEPDLASGRPATGHWVYLASLATLAALLSVLNARRPGNGAWSVLMSLLVLVFLIPWLESGGLARSVEPLRRLRLDGPWDLFYVGLAIAGVTNFLPTRYGPAAVLLGVGFALETLALTGTTYPPRLRARLWSLVPLCQAGSIWLAYSLCHRRTSSREPVEVLWSQFRDHWGVVWALRVRDRFNREAALRGWGYRLGWEGLDDARAPADSVACGSEGLVQPETTIQGDPYTTLRGLLRRFADAERLDAFARPSVGPP